MKKKKVSRKRRVRKFLLLAEVLILCAGIFTIYKLTRPNPEEVLLTYMSFVERQDYEAMYKFVEPESVVDLGKEGFITRNSKIYEGIEVSDLEIINIKPIQKEHGKIIFSYDTSFDSIAGEVSFSNEVTMTYTKDGYRIVWNDNLILPNLESTDRVSVSTVAAKRGEIIDRNGKLLAGKGTATSVGIVPGKLTNKEESLKKIAELLGMEKADIEAKLAENWVKEDSFVPISTITKVSELELSKVQPDEEVLKEKERQEQLLEISGISLSDTEVRTYPLKEATAHLTGYIQSVTAEDLEEHPDEGYNSNSVIGRSGMEALYEKELKGEDGCKISILDEAGNVKEVVAEIIKQDGENIQLTIDANLQQSLYEQFKDVPGCSAALNPYTGEVLALVSTPSYDNNDFIKGMTDEQWSMFNENEDRPLYNRFRQIWCPGSTFKPVTAAIGLDAEAFTEIEDFGKEGISWQKDSSWGSYQVTTLHTYEPVILKNALIYSDNIYFAKAALKIGADTMEKSLDAIGFNQELPFEITMTSSQYSNSEEIETEIQLADTGYGQGQVLVNPLHLASIYTAFLNEGNMIKPYLEYKGNAEGETWISGAFSREAVESVMEGLKGVVNDPNGTGYAAHSEAVELAGKTGTAEIKTTKEDTSGTEIGWFAVFTTEKDTEQPILIVSMVEDVKTLGGSGYVVRKDKAVLDEYLE